MNGLKRQMLMNLSSLRILRTGTIVSMPFTVIGVEKLQMYSYMMNFLSFAWYTTCTCEFSVIIFEENFPIFCSNNVDM